MLLVGESLDTAEDVPGWNIDLIKYKLWDDGDIVQCNRVTITCTTDENEIKPLINIVKHTAIFTIAYENDIDQFEAYNLFK